MTPIEGEGIKKISPPFSEKAHALPKLKGVDRDLFEPWLEGTKIILGSSHQNPPTPSFVKKGTLHNYCTVQSCILESNIRECSFINYRGVRKNFRPLLRGKLKNSDPP